MATQPVQVREPVEQAAAAPTMRAVLIAAVLAVLMGLVVQQVALVYNAGEIESSVPPVPAVMCLLALAAVNPLLRRLGSRWQLSRAELLTVYAVLVLSVAMSGRFFTRNLLAFITVPMYYQNLEDVAEQTPELYVPQDEIAITAFFESSRDGIVPWRLWAGPLGVWTAFLIVILGGIFCLLELFRKRWAEQEHLRFPLLYLPLELSAGGEQAHRAFLRNKLMWIGFVLGFFFALPVVVSPLWPNFPDWRATFYPFQALTGVPWNELRRIYMRPLPHLIGFGYLMSADNLLTIWAGYLLQVLAWVGFVQYGFRRPGWHTGQEIQQAMGAVIALAVWLMWANRRAFAQAFRSGDPHQGLRLAGAVAGFLAAIWFVRNAGAPTWMATAFVAMLFAEALVYARIRAETGLPSYYAVPFTFEERDFLLDLAGAQRFVGKPGLAALTGFSIFGWMTKAMFQPAGAYHVENLKLASESGMSRRPMLWLSLGAVLLGLLIAYGTCLDTFYDIGALSAAGAEGDGYYEVRWARGNYQKMLVAHQSTEGFQLLPNLFRFGGGAIVLLLAWLRSRYAGFPFTPWGYVVASVYGSTFWTSFLITWAAQKIVLRYWGARAHQRAIPFFLGISFGYMFATIAALGVAFGVGKPLSFASGKRLYFDI
ncbi:MAG: DUF6785 family protein [Armatimonadota bacterium]